MSLHGMKDILAEAKQKLRDLEKKQCRRCKKIVKIYVSGHCEECWGILAMETEERRQNSRIIDPEKGYVRVYNDEGKLVLEHRLVMEKHLGRKLKKHEVVLHRDLDNSNNAIENLMLSFKGGTPIEHLECTACGEKGKVTYSSPDNPATPVGSQIEQPLFQLPNLLT